MLQSQAFLLFWHKHRKSGSAYSLLLVYRLSYNQVGLLKIDRKDSFALNTFLKSNLDASSLFAVTLFAAGRLNFCI